MTKRTRGHEFALSVRELNGAAGDLGTLLPLLLGAVAVAGLAPGPALAGFGLFYLATAVYYRLPVPVQPMKLVAAVMLTAQLTPAALAATGLLTGAALLVLAATGWIGRIARLVPRSVLAGMQLGLGLALGVISVRLMAGAPVIAVLTGILLFVLMRVPGCPAVLCVLAAAASAGLALGNDAPLSAAAAGSWFTPFPTLAEFDQAVRVAVLPQLPLTIANAVVLTSLMAGDYFGRRAAHVTPERLAVSSGLANLLLAPFGAMPMCHGAGGLAAHYRFGARTGAAPLAIGLALLAAALLPGALGMGLLGLIPLPAVGALLLFASWELAVSKRLTDARPSCWPVIAAAAGVTLWADPFWGMLAGGAAELVRIGILRGLYRRLPD